MSVLTAPPSRPLNVPRPIIPKEWAGELEIVMKNVESAFVSKKVDPKAYTNIHNYLSNNVDYRAFTLLFEKLDEYLVTHLNQLALKCSSVHGVALLQHYAFGWKSYQAGAEALDRCLRPLNKRVVQERFMGRKDFFPAKTLALLRWKHIVLAAAQADLPGGGRTNNRRLTHALFDYIRQDRSQAIVDEDHIVETILYSFIAIGISEQNFKDESYDIYNLYFGDAFVSKEQGVFGQYLQGLKYNPEDYLFHIEELMWFMGKPSTNVPDVTRKRLLDIVGVHIKKYVPHMTDMCESRLAGHDFVGAMRVHAMMAHCDGSETFITKFRKTVEAEGSRVAARMAEGGDEVTPQEYVKRLYALYTAFTKCYGDTTTGTLNGALRAARDGAFESVMNRNDATGRSNQIPSDFLVDYVDLVLRRNPKKSKEELREELKPFLALFPFISERDYFASRYGNRLASRLLYGLATKETEAYITAEISDKFGAERVVRNRIMFNDMKFSQEHTKTFKERSHDYKNKSDFGFLVLNKRHWSPPFNISPRTPNIPSEITAVTKDFEHYYKTSEGRDKDRCKLTWMWKYSTCEMTMRIRGRSYMISANFHHMAVLLQYNEEDSMMLEDLIEATGIEREDMLSAISVLVKAKILIQGADEEVYDLNPNFKLLNGIRRINLLRPVKLKVSSKPDHEGPKPSDFFERRHYIRTVIRRVMKRHTTLTRNKIIHETNQLIVGPLWEKAQPHEVSAAIDLAINEDEMELVPGSIDTFKFIP